MDREQALRKAAAHWNDKVGAGARNRIRWWESPRILRHLNARMCGRPLEGFAAGFRAWLREEIGDLPLARGISVGCGTGGKEMALIDEGLVRHFDLYEISAARIAQGRELAERRGLSDRVSFHEADAFADRTLGGYDIVHWDNALHHMLDVPGALAWSRQVLRSGGILAIHDFVGPDRFQWSDRNLDYATRVRRMLPPAFLENGARPGTFVRAECVRPSVRHMIEMDPTEAAESASIVDAALKTFPGGRWVMLGGAVYHMALNDILWNFDRFDAPHLLEACLLVDDALSEMGENHYAAFVARA